MSRPFKLAVNIINFFLSTGIVFLSTSSWKESALFYAAISVLLFNTFMRGLSVVIDLGSSKFLFVSDDDIRIALCFAKRKSGEQGKHGLLVYRKALQQSGSINTIFPILYLISDDQTSDRII